MSSGPSVEQLLQANSVESDLDFLYLTRQLGRLPRCHTLSVSRHQSVAEHTLNCMFLLDYAFRNNLFIPTRPSHKSYQNIKDALQFHDVRESLCGDVPFPVSRHLSDYEEQVNSRMQPYFFEEPIFLTRTERHVLNQIDMLEFTIYISEELALVNKDANQFLYKRLRGALKNSITVSLGLLHTVHIDYKVNIAGLIPNFEGMCNELDLHRD